MLGDLDLRPARTRRFHRRIAALGACALALAGCSKSSSDPRTSDAAASDAAESSPPPPDPSRRGPPPEVAQNQADWPLPNRDYANTRAAETTIDSSNIAQLREAWRLPFDQSGAFGSVTSNPLIAGDTVYVQDMVSDVHAIDRETGARRWLQRIGAFTAGPNGLALGWGRLYANLGDTGIVALELGSGERRWTYEPELVRSEGIAIQPIAFDGRVFASTVPASLRGAYLGGSRGILFALDAVSGEAAWRFDTIDSADLWGNPSENGGGGAWYPPLIDPERGLIYWGTGNPAPWPGTARHPNGSSRPGANRYTSGVLALALGSGELRWFHQERAHDLFDWDFQNAPIRVRAGADSGIDELVIGSGKTGTVVALDPEQGRLRWRAKVGRHQNDALDALPEESIEIYPGIFGGVLTAPAYAGGVVYVPVVDLPSRYGASRVEFDGNLGSGALVALDVRDGRERWSSSLPAPSYGAATVVNDLVLTSDANGRVYAFARDSGQEVWHYDAGGGINAPLAVAGDLLLVPVGLGNSSLIALRLPRRE